MISLHKICPADSKFILGAMERILRDGDLQLRRKAALKLSVWSHQDYQSALSRMAKDTDLYVRCLALMGLERLEG